MLRTMVVSTIALSALAGASMVTTTAQAREGRNAAFAAGAAAGVVGGALLAQPRYGEPRYYGEPRRVYVEPEEECFVRRKVTWRGNTKIVRRVRVCD
jgi:hypothetical protein